MSDRTQTVLVLGAGGRLGAATVEAFARAGWKVFAQTRPNAGRRAPAAGIGVELALDATDQLTAVAAGTSVVVYAINPPYTQWSRTAVATLHQGLRVAERLGARLLFPGNVYNFGAGMPALLSEEAPFAPTTAKGEIRCAMEQTIEEASQRGLRTTIIRAGDFFGAGKGAWFDLAIAKSVHKGTLMYPGPADVTHAWAYLPDLAGTLVKLAERRQDTAFERYHYAGYTVTGAQFMDALEAAARSLGMGCNGFVRKTLPWWLFRMGQGLVPTWKQLLELEYLWRVPHGLDGTRMKRQLGGFAVTDLTAALRNSLIALGHPVPDPALWGRQALQ